MQLQNRQKLSALVTTPLLTPQNKLSEHKYSTHWNYQRLSNRRCIITELQKKNSIPNGNP